MKQSFDWTAQLGRYAPMISSCRQKLFAILDAEIGLAAGSACAVARIDTLITRSTRSAKPIRMQRSVLKVTA